MSPPTPSLWRREGLILTVPKGHPWWISHAQLPTVLPLSDQLWRIYFGARDADNHTHPVAVDVDPTDSMRVVAEYFDALFACGPPGAFDHFGAMPSSAHVVNGEVWLYYIGVFVRTDVRGSTAVGLATSRDGLSFKRAFEGPVWGIGPLDPYFAMSPSVGVADGGLEMFYAGGGGWRRVGDTLDPVYELRRTTSGDGLAWSPYSRPVFQPTHGAADAGQARPWPAKQAGVRKLWFSRRGEAFRRGNDQAYQLACVALNDQGAATGAAEPVSFENPPHPGDFDSWMQAYACVLPLGDDLVMIYNGDGFGQSGIGWARLPGAALPEPTTSVA